MARPSQHMYHICFCLLSLTCVNTPSYIHSPLPAGQLLNFHVYPYSLSVWSRRHTPLADNIYWNSCILNVLVFAAGAVTSSVVYYNLWEYTRKEKCYLFVFYNKNSNGLLNDFGAWKKKNKSADVYLTSSVCPLIDHGQQPMKIHTEVTLLYKYV